ncbi:penicillin-binding transpeptidase domain-containing protein [Paenibacillus cellulositrophicus]|uniref:penicillin-binding transpeptidase domain-containing protein n=1 Tax=Paenibacillus cellulositrophicus TaxID=562959 RepID=UPI00203FC0CE|nr:penicillin-binding transpeptidase domain-containing protein [Paenibacillus cellulositrophicus]MCM2999640.1 penicillin-binding transpeptidase domain-containing protein [Paenibacillus cellulositrophicus]
MVKRIKLRTLLLGGFITLLFVVLLIRVFALQVVNGDDWHDRAVAQWTKKVPIPASRGTITDRNGDILASDVPAYTVIVNPAVIHENGLENEIIEGLHKILGKDESELKELVNAKDKDGEYLTNREVRNEGWKIDETKKAQIEDLNKELKAQLKKEKKVLETGLDMIKEQKRYYPKGTLAAHILGYTNRDGEAVAGLEASLDDYLKGTSGLMKYESDRQGDQLPEANMVYKPAVNGKNLKLTIDDTIQYYIEDAMKETYEKYQPISMTVIAADPKTMEILGMANLPTFNPNTYWNTKDQKDFFNYAVKATYEPGSTFKIVTLAGAVQEKLFNPNAIYQSGQIQVKGTHTYLHDINRYGWGPITFLEGVKRSSNVAFVKLGSEMLGKDRLLKYIKDFGFGQKTGIELPGEVSTTINLPGPVEVATASYGHGVSVTPIQQLAAISAVANGGKLLTPHIIKEITDPDTGKVIKSTKTDVVRQVISPEAAKETSSYLEQVVADQVKGTGRNAYIDGYRVAGKTGTAVKYGSDGKPDYSKSVVSFVGFAPVNDPKIALIVIVDQPNDPDVGGGTVAAPIFKKIVSQALPYMGVPKANTKKTSDGKTTSERLPAPTLTKLAVKDAKQKLLNAGIDFETIGKGTSVIRQFPAAGTPMSPGQRIYLLTEETDKMTVPDLKGESLRDALDILTLLKCSVTVEGQGYVSEQLVTDKNGKRSVQLTLKPVKDEETSQDTSSSSTKDDSGSKDTSTGDSADGKSGEEASDN